MSGTTSSAKSVSIVVPAELQEAIEAFVESYQRLPRNLSCPEQLHQAEQGLAGAADRLCSCCVQVVIQQSVASQEPGRYRLSRMVPESLRLASLPTGFKNQGRRTVTVRLCRGGAVAIRVTYYSRRRDRPNDRGGCYPALQRLGIFDRCSPSLASQAALTVALAGSLEEARQMLQLQGAYLGSKTLTALVYRLACRARENLRRDSYRLPGGTTASGLRLVVALDGGRLRLRQAKRGRRRRSGRHGYTTPWREPKLLYIYALDESGKKLDPFAPIIDGPLVLLSESEELFVRLSGYLAGLQAQTAKEIVFIGDGAPWVSNRVPKLVKGLKLAQERVRVVVDFYHAVEHLKAAAEEQRLWTEAQREAWVKRQRSRLYRGWVAKVVEEMEPLEGKKGKDGLTEKEYFANRKGQMQYASFRKAAVPIGSGAVESAMRRVVNLRLKGAGTFWLKHNAEHVLLLRCYAKAGRWTHLRQLALRSTLLIQT
jgi:hypothetical protein